MNKIITIFTLACLTFGKLSASQLSESNWADIPSPGDITWDDICAAQTAPIEKHGRTWTLALHNTTRFDFVTHGGPSMFDVKMLGPSSQKEFSRLVFSVDSAGRIRYDVMLVSKDQLDTGCDTTSDTQDSRFLFTARISFTTQLTPEELGNPIVAHLKSHLTFKEQDDLFESDEGEYQATVGSTNVQHLRLFVNPQYAAALEEGSDDEEFEEEEAEEEDAQAHPLPDTSTAKPDA